MPSPKPKQLRQRIRLPAIKGFLTKTTLMCLASTIGGVIGYSGLFLILLQIKFLRDFSGSAGQEFFLTAEVVLGALTCVVTVTGVVFLFIDRAIAGRFFTIATVVGAALLALTTALILEKPQPPQGLERFYVAGLVIGNVVVAGSNIAAFYSKLPSM